MDVFVARQPIFDRNKAVTAYELLFRAGLKNAFPVGMDGDLASAHVINNTLLVFGFDALLTGHAAYVNVTERVLMEKRYAVLPQRRTVIEILETVDPTPGVVSACKEAKKAGYVLALDDFVFRPGMEPLLQLADIVKVDILATDVETRKALPARLAKFNVKLLAEKVEDMEQYRQALAEGYIFFQGYFFSKPEIVSRKDVPTSKLAQLQILRELQKPQLDFEKLEQVIKMDIALSMKLLRYLNSAAFGWRSRVTSLKQAIVMLGERPFRQWASLVTVMAIASDKPAELATVCLARARFCEMLGPKVGIAGRQLDMFLMGLLSAIDALVGRPLAELLSELAISKDVESALSPAGGASTPFSQVLALILAYEKGAWEDVARLTAALRVGEESVVAVYREAVQWASMAAATA